MSEREPLAGQDNAWRRMGTAYNLMSITGVLTFEQPVEYDEFCDRLEERLLGFARFEQYIGGRQRIVRRPYWEAMSDMDVRSHVFEVALPEPADKEEFERFIGSLVSRPLDEKRPLWEAYLIQNAGSGDGNAVAFRLNHSIGDGFALLSVLLGLVDNPGDIELPVSGISKATTPAESDDGAATTGTASAAGTDRENRSWSMPSVTQLVEGVKTAGVGIERAYNLVTMTDDQQTSLHGGIGTRKRVAWTDEIDLATVKEIGHAYDATVNDVLLGATAGGLRRLFEGRDEDTEGMEVRCTVPVNLKGMDERDGSLGNYFGLAFIPIPVGKRDLEDRIRTIRERTSKRKLGTEAFLMLQLLRVGGYVPFPVQRKVMEQFQRKSMGVFTNVPGPSHTLELAGTEISDVMFWVPQSLDQSLGISIFSYDGDVRMGVNSDANRLPEPAKLTDAFETEIGMLFEQRE